MPSKFRKAIGAVKDQTSISLAKVSNNNSSNLDIAILKATTHDEIPVDERYINEVLLLTSSNKIYAASSAQSIAKRIGKTRNWVVALKSLMLVLRLFQDGDPYFPREVLHTMKRGAKILNLSNFRDDSNSSPWDFTAFVRTYALYLDERLNCFLMGKLQRRAVLHRIPSQRRRKHSNEHVRDMKPAILIDRISYWQQLLERSLATRPTGAAKTNRLIQISLYSVVKESFDLYRDISDGVALLLDSFFHLQFQSCVDAFQTCVKASKQFEELSGFYALCRGIGVGRRSEYPSVQKISDELIETLQEFLKNQSSFPSGSSKTAFFQPPSSKQEKPISSNHHESSEERDSVSLEDLFSVTDAAISDQISEKQSSVPDLLRFFDDEISQPETSISDSRKGWEFDLAETASNISSSTQKNGFESGFLDSLYENHQLPITPHQHTYSNPFLSSDFDTTIAVSPISHHERHYSSSVVVHQVSDFPPPPTFSAQNPDDVMNDPFGIYSPRKRDDGLLTDGSVNQQNFIQEQQSWLQNQNKIIARHVS